MRDYPTDCGKGFDKMELYTYEPFLHTKGCSEALYEKVYNNLDIAIGISVVVGALQVGTLDFSNGLETALYIPLNRPF